MMTLSPVPMHCRRPCFDLKPVIEYARVRAEHALWGAGRAAAHQQHRRIVRCRLERAVAVITTRGHAAAP